jgi:hypothetical protein
MMSPEIEQQSQRPSGLSVLFDTNLTALNYLVPALTEFYIGERAVVLSSVRFFFPHNTYLSPVIVCP